MGDSDSQIILPFNFRLDFTEEEYILHQPGEEINEDTGESNNQILVEYGAKLPSNLKTRLEDLTDLEDRVKTLERGGNFEYIIDKIKVINFYVGTDECVNLHTDKEPKDIIRENNEKLFQHYRTVDENNNLDQFGVKVQTYNDDFTGDLFSIDKKIIQYIWDMKS
jgi:hypothetical protein